MSQVMEHVHQLAEVIGPRPAATDAEANAADYIEDVFRTRGLDVERQEFDAARTTSWPFVICHVLTLLAVALTFWLPLVAVVPAVLAAVLLWFELSTRSLLSRFMPKGPSQNIIARHVPRQRRGERLKRVVIVAHYDSAKSSLAYSPGMVKHQRTIVTATKVMTFATPFVIVFAALPFASAWQPWTGVAAIVVGGGLVVPLLIAVHRELLMHATDGANANASGVAAMISVMEATVPEPDEVQFHDRPLRRSVEAAYDAGVAPDEALLEYRSVDDASVPVVEDASLGGFGDIDWETGTLEPVSPRVSEPVSPVVPESAPASSAPSGDWAEEAGVGPLWEDVETPAETPRPVVDSWRTSRPAAPSKPAPAPIPARWDATPPPPAEDEDLVEGQERLMFEPAQEAPAPAPKPQPTAGPSPEPDDDDEVHQGHGISAWLGIGKGFDVRKAGKQIGSWDNIDDDDEFGFKAGTAGDPAGEDGSAVDSAARIRRRVTENVDRALVEKEIWFVATGADDAGGCGIRALLEEYGDDLDDALIINIENVGAGAVGYVTEEGMGRTYRSDRRLVTQAKRTARENGIAVKGGTRRGLTTSVTPALARRFKAMTIMAFDINGRVPNWRWRTDTVDNVTAKTVEQAAGFVTALVRDL
ncbi:MAG: hypothetical protein Q7W51_00805 [Coriobacteriia bacterium]|nr:hypothetical protein [Coriobacteriia bacterium]